jgi:type VI secretion system protein ImpA
MITQDLPCGEPLDHSIDYAVLAAKLAPRADVQYGSFSSKVEGPDWVDIDKSCTELLKSSIDITVLIWLTRARVQQTGAIGLAEGLGLLLAHLGAQPQHIHPQLMIEGEPDPAVRANALAALADPDGLLGDASTLLISSNTVTGLSVADVTRAYSVPRQANAKTPEQVQSQLAHLVQAGSKDDKARIAALAQSQQLLGQIEAWSIANLGEESPNLARMKKLLQPFAGQAPSLAAPTEPVPAQPVAQGLGQAQSERLDSSPDPSPASNLPPTNEANPTTRDQARALIDQARVWFEANEPSSPVGILLKQAHKQVGMRFAQLAASIPADLLAQWDQD